MNGIPDRSHSWTGADLRKALFNSGRHDLVFLAGHFSANDTALAADYASDCLLDELAGLVRPTSSTPIVFSAGCHSGYNIVNGGRDPQRDGADRLGAGIRAQGATLIAGTGYQYGHTDFLAYSERISPQSSRASSE